MEILVRHPRVADEEACAALLATAWKPAEARALVASHFREHRIVVAEAGGAVVGLLAWRTDWFGCTFVVAVLVKEGFRRRGVAREMFRAVEHLSPGPRMFSSSEEGNAAAIRMHAALGFQPSGWVDNLPRGGRELIHYRRIPPRAGPPPAEGAAN
ncbi:MAG: GNAT family N-acetyltransferase [Planctomycetaceae bacterium]|nr:GNAT family N-acetyltransferase [Planctomycetota bacterium]NUN53324.1 GNAT family N-acetyltransferase [Planctomycetaceae bacterium]